MESDKCSPISKQILCMKLRYWLYLILFFQYTLVVFIFGSIGTRRWVRKGNDITEWEGGLLSVTSSNSNFKDETFQSAKDTICDMDLPDSDLCQVFEDLYSAGAAYLFFDLLALLFILLWIFQVIWALMEKPLNRWWVALLWPSISFMCHLLGICIWAGITKSNFEENCLALNSNKLCSTNGPALAILIVFLYLFFTAIYAFVVFFRDGIRKKAENEEKDESRA